MTNDDDSKMIRRIGNAAQLAGVLEASTEKPGNVTPKHDFSDTTFEDFLMGSIALGQSVEKAAFRGYRAGRKEISVHDIGIGKLILEGVLEVRDSHEGGNTHLGMLMLFIPIAAAAGMCVGKGEKMSILRRNISNIVEESSIEDSYCFYSAIKESGSGGISKLVEESMSFYELMKYSAQKDMIAHELSGGLEIIFNLGLPAFESYYQEQENLRKALLKTYIILLSKHPDTFIIKKAGMETAKKITELASKVMAGNLSIEALDAELRTQGSILNPGTTADIVSAILFIWLIYDSI